MATQNYFKAKNGLEAPSQSTIAVTDSNFPTVRPTLNLDFAGSESVDSRITFTRASAATYTGADGKIKYAVQNEPRIEYDPITGECKGLLIEEQRTNLSYYSSIITSWVAGNGGANNNVYFIPNSVISPTGEMNGSKMLETTGLAAQHSITQGVSVTSGQTYTFSVYAKAAERNIVGLVWGIGGFGSFLYASFNLSTGTVITTTGVTSASIQSVGNGWYRCIATATATATATTSHEIKVQTQGLIQNETYVGDTSKGIYLYGVQFEAGSFATSYIPSTTAFTSRASSATYFDSTGTLRIAGANQARYGYGYDSTSGKWVSQGLILENASTNLLAYSSDFISRAGAGNWYAAGGAVVTQNTTAAPDGSQTADTYAITTGNADFLYSAGYPVTSGTVYTLSIYVKLGTATNVALVPNNTQSWGSVTGGKVFTSADGLNTNSFTRISVTFTAPASNAVNLHIGAHQEPGLVAQSTGTLYLWGAQLEVGSTATSYIPTYGSTATRAADVSSSAATTRSSDSAVIKNLSWYNTTAGSLIRTIAIKGDSLIGPAAARYTTGFYNSISSSNNRLHLRLVRDPVTPYADAIARSAYDTTQNQFDTDNVMISTSSSTYRIKQGVSYITNNVSIAINGVSGGADTTFVPPQNIDTFQVLSAGELDTLANGSAYVEKIVYYAAPISATQLQALTA